ncbi:MAG: hypothetical protein ACTJGH_04785 [Peptoniphilaceae bacterium]
MSLRLKNLTWTISENYEINPNLNMFYKEITSPYKAALLGIYYKIYDFKEIDNFLKAHKHSKNNFQDLVKICELSLENASSNILLELRPGIIDYKKQYENKILTFYSKSNPHNIAEELEKAYYEYLVNRVPKINGSLYSLLKEILNFKSTDTLELLKFLEKIYKNYFHIYKNSTSSEKVEKIIKRVESKKKKALPTKLSKSEKITDLSQLEKYSIESAEFTSAEYDNLKVVKDLTKNTNQSNKYFQSNIEKNYGISYLMPNDSMELENKLCTGIHSGIKLHFTKGDYADKYSFNALRIEEIYEDNLSKFKESELFYKRAIKNLSEVIKNSLLKDSEEFEIKSESGRLIPSKIWESKYLQNNKIFKKIFNENNGDISIDILLDASASQETRQSEIAIEGYIIASALTELNIKTRVFSFNNLFNYLILKKFRDYNDPKYKNKEILKYRASGSNRDGLAIKVLTDLIEKNSEERKILIVLSDGKPNNETNLGLVGSGKTNVKSYSNEIAIKDSYENVLSSRMKGIDVLGVFTGLEEDLESEKKIYGSDFAYITSIERFHQIVGLFFKSIANKLY